MTENALVPASPDGARNPLLLGLGWDEPGGLNRYVQDLHVALEASGTPNRVLALGPATTAPSPLPSSASPSSASPPSGPSSGWSSIVVPADASDPLAVRLLRYARAVAREQSQASAVDAHFALLAAWPVLAGSLRSRPFVVHFHGPWGAEGASVGNVGWKAWAKRTLEGAVYRRASAVVVLSSAFGRLVVERFGVQPERVHVVPPGVDLGRFTPGRAEARRDLGLADDTEVVFTARRLVPRVGLEVLLDAWALVRRPGRVLQIAGEGASRPALERRVAELELQGSVQLLGRISEADLVSHYRAADLCVLPSIALEGFGLTALEALACGTPVVATDVGGLPEALSGLDPSLIVPPSDPGALAARLETALAGDVPSAAACRQHAERFSWSTAAARHREIYRAVSQDLSQAVGEDVGEGRPEAEPEAGHDAGHEEGRPLRVVYLDHCARMSGAEIALLRLLPALPGVEPHVVLAEDGPLRAELTAAGISTELLPMDEQARGLSRNRVKARLPLRSGLATAAYVARLTRRLRRLRPDLVHANSLKADLYGGVAARLAGIPVVWHARDRAAPDYMPSSAVRLVQAAARHLPAAVIAVSQVTLDTLDLPVSRLRRAAVIGDPYRPEHPHQSEGARRGGAGRDGNELRFGMVGRLAPWKGQLAFVEAFAGAFPQRGTERAVLVGGAMFGELDYELELKQRVEQLGLGDRVEFRGFQSDIEAELARLDVLVHASVIPEAFGQVVVEGMAAGLPVIASAGGPSEIIRHDLDGLLHPPADVEALAASMRRLALEPLTRRRLGAAAVGRAADYRPEVIGPQVVALYRSVLAWSGLTRDQPRTPRISTSVTSSDEVSAREPVEPTSSTGAEPDDGR